LFSNRQKKIIRRYSRAIDEINISLGQAVELYTNSVLSKSPYAGDGLIALLHNNNLSEATLLRKFYYLCKYFVVSFGFVILWSSKKMLYTFIGPNFDSDNIQDLHIVDIFVLSKDIVKSGKFNDRYLSNLVSVLNENNLNYAYLPYFYQDGYNPIKWFKLYKILKNSEHQFVSEFDLITWSDVLKMVVFLFRYPFALLGLIKSHKIENDIDKAIHCSLEHSLQKYTLKFYIRYLIGNNLAKKIDSFKLLSYCEYQDVDRTLYKGVNDVNSKNKIYAYQQLRKHDFFMNMQIPEQDQMIGHAPDKIIVNGKYYIPEKTNYDYMALAIRNKEVFTTKINSNADNCLVLLPYLPKESIKILSIVLGSKISKYNLYIKPHPILSPKILKQYWSNNHNIIDGDLYQYLPNTKIIITSVGGAALEMVAIGVSVIIVADKNEITINPLIELGVGEIWDVVYNAEELSSVYMTLIQERVRNPSKIKELAKQYKDLFFSKPTEKLILESFDG
jgi:hypothetical protein